MRGRKPVCAGCKKDIERDCKRLVHRQVTNASKGWAEVVSFHFKDACVVDLPSDQLVQARGHLKVDMSEAQPVLEYHVADPAAHSPVKTHGGKAKTLSSSYMKLRSIKMKLQRQNIWPNGVE